jgi:hypothetical protein
LILIVVAIRGLIRVYEVYGTPRDVVFQAEQIKSIIGGLRAIEA